MIIAVTGGSGFIGRHLIARHLAEGDEVRYLTRQPPSPSLAGAKAFAGHLNAPLAELEAFLDRVDVLYHCAAELRDEALMQATNVDGTANLLAAAKGRVKRWVQLSSTGVYGQPRHQTVDESAPMNPCNAYERSKAAADALVSQAAEAGLDCVLLRPSNVYGVDMPNQSLFQWIRMLDKGMFFYIGNPGAMATYIHVENVVDALMLCGKSPLPKNGAAYIVSDDCTLETFVGTICTALQKKAPALRVPETIARMIAKAAAPIGKFPLTEARIDALSNRTVYLSDKIAAELGYRHRISIEDGIAELARHWRRNPR